MPKHYHDQVAQGDVLLTPIASLPSSVKKVKRDGGRVILAYGETTGHAHAFAAPNVTLYETEDARRFVEIRERAATLAHEEHGHITLEPGLYEVGSKGVRTQRQYTPDAIIAVRD